MKERLSVQQRIKLIAEKFTKCDYVYMNWSQLNKEQDHLKRATICYVLPPSGKLRPSRGASSFTDKPETMIAFLIPTSFDFDGDEVDCHVELMKTLACEFIRALNESGLFEMIDDVDISYKVPYGKLDDCVTGVILDLPIVETPQTMCQISEIFGYENG